MLRYLPVCIVFFITAACGDGKPGLFSANGYHIGKDKVWYKTSTGMAYNVNEVMGADPKTFTERTFKDLGGNEVKFGVDRGVIYWDYRPIEGADLPTFQYLQHGYSRDKRAAYFQERLLTTDLAHFEIVSLQFVKDAQYVYFGGNPFSEDPAHFVRVGGDSSSFFKDSKHCWYDIYEIKTADPATLRYVGGDVAADARQLYFEMNPIEGADQQSFQRLPHRYSRDAHRVYLKSEPVEGADPATFRVLSEDYTVDTRRCYYQGYPMEGAEPAAFQVIEPYYAKDAHSVFIGEKKIIGADPATFRVLNNAAGCSCDAKQAYSMDQPMPGVNPANFPAGRKCKSCSDGKVIFD